MELREGKNHHFYEKLKSNKLNQNEFKNTPFFFNCENHNH